MIISLHRPLRAYGCLCRSLSTAPTAFATTFPFGLTGAGATGTHYTTSLDLSTPLLLRGGSTDFMAAARADARERLGLPQQGVLDTEQTAAQEGSVKTHLSAARSSCSRFLRSGAVHDREEIKTALEGMFQEEGQLALLQGGKSVGKSLLLAELAGRADLVGADGSTRAVLNVDARLFSTNLSAGLQNALRGENKEPSNLGWRAWLGLAWLFPRRVQPARPVAGPSRLALSARLSGKLYDISTEAEVKFADPLSPMQRNLQTLSAVVEKAQRQGLYICLIVDEANLAFPTPPASGRADDQPQPPSNTQAVENSKLLLEGIVQLTKQTRKMNVLIVTSEYAFPYRLQHGNFFNPANLTATYFAGEVPPAQMRALLQGTWGLGPRLSDVFLAYYGGHVHTASQALFALASMRDAFKCTSVAPLLADHSISLCLQSSSVSAQMAGMLAALAERGYAPVKNASNECAQLLARSNLAGLVTSSCTVVGLPDHVRTRGYGVVPSSNFMRHLFAIALYEMKAEPNCGQAGP